MAVHAADLNIRHLRGAPIHRWRLGDIDTELVFLQPGGDIRMSHGIHIGIDSQRDRRLDAELGSHLLQPLQLSSGLHIEAMDTHLQGTAHFVSGFAQAGKDDPRGLTARRQHPLQFADRDDVKARPQTRQQIQHGQIGVGLDGETHQMRCAAQGVVPFLPGLLDSAARVDKTGGAILIGNRGQWQCFGVQSAVLVFKGCHGCDQFAVGCWDISSRAGSTG